MRLRITLAGLLLIVFCQMVQAVAFDEHFSDSTLRVDIVFAGNKQQSGIYLDGYVKSAGWYGRRGNLSEPPYRGNGAYFVTESESGDTVYAGSFTSLYQEWVLEPESSTTNRCYDHCLLLPLPKRACNITVELYDAHQQTVAQSVFAFNPSDILVRRVEPRTSYRYIGEAHDAKQAIDIALIPEGYTSEEMDTFYADCERARQAILAHEPYTSFADRFNFLALHAPSAESGASVPREGVWKESVCSSHFDTFYSDRYNTTKRLRQVNELLNGIPYEHILILCNSQTYGGGGFYNDYCIASAYAPWTLEVIVHEFGHSFGGLADEYATANNGDNYYPADVEPWEPNVTTLRDFGAKWQDMVGKDGVGLFEGAGYQEKGVYRPVENCRMRVNQIEYFCPVCQRALTRLIKYYTE